MRKFYVGYSDGCKLANDFIAYGQEVETIDFRDGSLQDYFLCTAGNLLIAGFEHYENPWSSSIELWIAQTDRDKARLEKKWYEFTEAYDIEYPQEER